MDALEYDLPSTRHNPPSISSPISAAPPYASPNSDADESHGTHTFKIVTTKRTLLLCAPTEEDEIKWLGAVRALIARRSGTGTVPGEVTSQAAASLRSADGSIPSGVPPGGNVGLKSKVRRLSVTGSGGLSSGVIPEESAQEKP